MNSKINLTIVTTYDVGIGAGTGLYDVVEDTAVGIYETIEDPKGAVESLIHAGAHPVETYKYIEKSIVDSYERDMINGNAESRSHWVTYALGTTATAVVGTKGAGALTKTGVATTKTAVQKSVTTVSNTMNTMQSSRLTQILPYGPRTQVALPGSEFFSGPVLKENWIMQARKLEDSGGGLNGTVKSTVKLKHPVLDNARGGSALKDDIYHGFNDIVDNYAVDAQSFDLPNKKGHIDSLHQIEGSMVKYDTKYAKVKNNASEMIQTKETINGVFEWVVNPTTNTVTHRTFIPGGKVTGKINQWGE